MDFFFGVFLFVQTALFVGLESTPGILDRQGRVRGRDFLQFYLAGRIIARGEAHRLYDQTYFLELQRSLVEFEDKRPPYLSIYPPQVALLFSPLGRLPYGRSIEVWWLVQAACFLTAGCVLFRALDPSPSWRHTAWLGLLSYFPVINTFWNGQLVPLLLLAFVVGAELRRRGYTILGGAVLSLVAIKPQFGTGIALWLALRRDMRTGVGFGVGLLLQAGAVATLLSPQVLADFVDNARLYAQHFNLQHFTPDHQHALTGILVEAFGASYGGWVILAQLTMVAYAGIIVIRLLRSQWHLNEYIQITACIIFVLLGTPHLLTYDLAYLLIPMSYLLRVGSKTNATTMINIVIVLYLFTQFTVVYAVPGFSVVPIVLVWALRRLANMHPNGDLSGCMEDVRNGSGPPSDLQGVCRPAL